MTSLLAMLFIVLFSVLAVGFYAQTTLTAQIAHNEQNQARAQLAAESGVQYMRYRLNQLKVKYCPPEQLMPEVFRQLEEIEYGSGNLEYGMQEIGIQGDGNSTPREILYPKDPTAIIRLRDGEKGYGFRARISRLPGTRSLVVKVAGYGGGKTNGSAQVRGIEYTYRTDEIATNLFDYGVVGRGQVEVSGSGQIRGAVPSEGNVYTTTALNPAVAMTGPSVITGDVYLEKGTATVSYATNSSVAGSTAAAWKADHTHKPWPLAGKPPVDFPVLDTADFIPYAKNVVPVGAPVGTYFKNIIIPAGRGTASTPYIFSSGTVVEGVVYIKSPNVVRFAGSTTVRGVVIGDNTTAAGTTLLTNVLEFSGTATAYDIATLPDNNPTDFPPELQAMKGSTIVLPGFHVKFSGGHAAVSGSIASDQLTFSGSSSGTITGSVIGMSEQKLVVSGAGVVQVTRPPPTPWPAGIKFRHRWLLRPDSYREMDRTEAKKV
jgi:hypothetical protein